MSDRKEEKVKKRLLVEVKEEGLRVQRNKRRLRGGGLIRKATIDQ